MDSIQIFISYARTDEEPVKALYKKLEEAGYGPWLDCEDLLPGQLWEPTIEKAIKSADFVLVCLSANSINRRGFIQKEIRQALEHAQTKLEGDVWLIPVRLDGCEVPESLSKLQWVDLFASNGWEKLLRAMEFQLAKLGMLIPLPQHKPQTPEPASAQAGKPESQSELQVTAPPAQIAPPIGRSEPKPDLQAFEFNTVTLNSLAEETERRRLQAWQYTEELGDGVTIEMVQVTGGTFLMGASEDEEGWRKDEGPQHMVTVPGFFIGKYQVTQAQWRAIAGAEELKVKRALNPDPSYFKGDNRLPVEEVSWEDAVEFCARLAKKTGRPYSLPSESEWEYACRAGTATPFHFGATITPEFVNYDGDYPYGNAPKGEYRQRTMLSGSIGVANGFGLCDMHGNVWEWCQDVWHASYDGAPTDGSAWGGSKKFGRVLRGGSWIVSGNGCRSAFRYRYDPGERVHYVGFRVACAGVMSK
jgi:formylglycine-generating enzyme required for sulfatase activity